MENKQEVSIYEGLGEVMLNLAELQLLINRLRKDDKK